MDARHPSVAIEGVAEWMPGAFSVYRADEPTERFDGKRVLLADDIAVNRQVVVAALKLHGTVVEEAMDGRQAVELVERSEAGYYDVILMDIQMPVMNGYDATRAIRGLADRNKAEIPIFGMPANDFDDEEQAAREAGMNGQIKKPIDRKKLIEVLGKL